MSLSTETREMASLPKPALSPTAAAACAPFAPPPDAALPAFPTTALGPLISAAAASAAARTQAPVVLAAHHLLTLAAMAAQRLISLRLPTGALRPVSCYVATLCGTGEGRGALSKAVVDPMRDTGGAGARRLGLFVEPRAPSASDRYRAVRYQSALFAERGAAVFAAGRARYAEAASLAGLWDGRVETGSVLTKPFHPRLSLHLAVTPRDAQAMLSDPDLAEGGLLGRLLVAAPASTIGRRDWQAVIADEPSAEIGAFHARMKALCAQDPTADTRTIAFTAAAASQWRAFAQEVEIGMRDEGAFAPIRLLAGHLAEHAARLAAVIAFTEDEALAEVDEAALARGITLARFYAGEALRLSHLTPVVETPAEITEQLQIWLERTHADRTVTLREVCRSGPPCIRDADLAYRHMRRLERLGVVRQKALMPETSGKPRQIGVSYAWHVGLHAAPANSPCPSRGVA
jgi:hypothetical protein